MNFLVIFTDLKIFRQSVEFNLFRENPQIEQTIFVIEKLFSNKYVTFNLSIVINENPTKIFMYPLSNNIPIKIRWVVIRPLYQEHYIQIIDETSDFIKWFAIYQTLLHMYRRVHTFFCYSWTLESEIWFIFDTICFWSWKDFFSYSPAICRLETYKLFALAWY